MQGTNAHMVFSLAPPSLLGQQAVRQGAAAPWRRRRFWFNASPHPLILRHAPAPPVGSGAVLLEADLGTAAVAAYLRQHQVGGQALLPTTALLELAAGAGGLLAEDGSEAVPAVVAAAVTRPLPLPQPPAAGGQQPQQQQQHRTLLLAVVVDARTGKTRVTSGSSPAQLLACRQGLVGTTTSSAEAAGPAARAGAAAGPAGLAAVHSPAAAVITQLVGPGLSHSVSHQPGIAAAAELVPAGLDKSGYHLPPSVCEAVASLQAAGGQSGPGVIVSCEVFVLASRAAADTLPAVRSSEAVRLSLHRRAGGSSALAVQSGAAGVSLLRMAGVATATTQPGQDASYAVSWKRVEAGEADARWGLLLGG